MDYRPGQPVGGKITKCGCLVVFKTLDLQEAVCCYYKTYLQLFNFKGLGVLNFSPPTPPHHHVHCGLHPNTEAQTTLIQA